MIAVGPSFLEPLPPKPHFRPRGPLLHVRFLPVASTWASGIHLPQSMQTNSTEAEVLGVGPGRYLVPDALSSLNFRVRPWPQIGDVVVFEPHMARLIGPNEVGIGENEAFIDCEACLGVVRGDGSLSPLSDWIVVKPETRPDESAGGVRLGDRVQRWRQRGTVVSWGPGYLYTEGPCAVKRKTVPGILNLSTFRAGLVVYWKASARILQIGRDQVEAWMCRAGDLVAWEEP